MHGLRICLNFHLFFFFVCALICNLTYFRNYKEGVSLCIKKSIDSNFLFFMKFCVRMLPVWCTHCPAMQVGSCRLEVSVKGALLSLFLSFFFPPSPPPPSIHLPLFQLSCSIKFQSAPSFFVLLPKLISCLFWIHFPYQSFFFVFVLRARIVSFF